MRLPSRLKTTRLISLPRTVAVEALGARAAGRRRRRDAVVVGGRRSRAVPLRVGVAERLRGRACVAGVPPAGAPRAGRRAAGATRAATGGPVSLVLSSTLVHAERMIVLPFSADLADAGEQPAVDDRGRVGGDALVGHDRADERASRCRAWRSVPTCQNTLQGLARLMSRTRVAEAVIRSAGTWKMNAALGSFSPSSIICAGGEPQRRRARPVDAGPEGLVGELGAGRRGDGPVRGLRHGGGEGVLGPLRDAAGVVDVRGAADDRSAGDARSPRRDRGRPTSRWPACW